MLKTLCQCLGLSSLILLVNYADLLGGGGNVRLHAPLPLSGICIAHLADIVLLGLLFFAILAPLRGTRFYPVARLMIALLVPPYLLSRNQTLLPFPLPDGAILVLAAAWAAVLLLLLIRFPLWYRKTMHAAAILGACFAIFAGFSVLQLLWLMRWQPGPQQRAAIWETTPQPPRQHAKLVWIVFDELSYDQLFEHRARDLELPSFDELRAQSTLFSSVQPAGYKTVKIIPSLLGGQTVDDFQFDWNNRFLVHTVGTHGLHPLTGSGTVFADAQQAGWRTAAVGWYNPYCTIYSGTIDDCYWANWDKLDGPMAQRDTLYRNTVTPLRQLERQLTVPMKADRDVCTYDVRHRLPTHLDLESHALKLLRTDQADFVFLHLAIPHSPNIWSRMDDDYTHACDSSYLDNLALADREMHTILGILQASARWKDTTLIVEGDHGWRIDLWNWLPAWTDEDDAASRGVFDNRPALLIHQPGQTTPQTEAEAWPLLRVHDVVDEVLRGQPVHF